MPDTIVIAGAGHAAGQTAVSLRQGGYAGELIIIGEEAYLPYQRPPLSKKFLSGELELERLYLRPERYYADHDVEVRTGTRVTAIDRDAKTVALDNGDTLPYTKLVLATGTRVRKAGVDGEALDGVHYLRTINDVLAMQENFKAGARLVVVGAGYIGLEVAAVGVQKGLAVSVREIADRVLARVASPELSAFYQCIHADAGVDLRLGEPPISAITGSGKVEAVVNADGTEDPADMVVIGIGVMPASELAAAAGLPCDNGIVVDEFCQTEDPDILAIGDCTNHPNSLLGKRLRLESVHNAQEQAKTAAATLLGQPKAYAQVPWFWSDQYDLKLQIAGLTDPGYERVVRGGIADRSLAVFHLEEGRLQAVEAVNSAREFMLGKKLIAAKAALDATELADPSKPFKAIADAALS
jgi:3-phenylpropionate/trans-cinnamate dioxygenase ferredoxin reductase subunit